MLNEFELWDEIEYVVYDKTCIITSVNKLSNETIINAISKDLSYTVNIDEKHRRFWNRTGRNFKNEGETFYNKINKDDWGD